MIRRSLWLIVLLGLSCGLSCDPPKPPPPVTECAAACDRLNALGCELGKPTAEGTPCNAWCEAYGSKDGKKGTIDVPCLGRASSCAEAERCGR